MDQRTVRAKAVICLTALALGSTACRHVDRSKAERYLTAAEKSGAAASAALDVLCSEKERERDGWENTLTERERASKAAHEEFLSAYGDLMKSGPPDSFRTHADRVKKQLANVTLQVAAMAVSCTDGTDPALKKKLDDAKSDLATSITLAREEL